MLVGERKRRFRERKEFSSRLPLQQDDKISTDGFKVEKRLEKTDTKRYVCVREGERESRDLPKKSSFFVETRVLRV